MNNRNTEERKFEIKDYGRKSTFASFLPGIAGIKGIPIWCYYVNRGQAVASFGVENKDHAIMEFYPAHMAYQNVKTTGFRTFIKVNGSVCEAFLNEKNPHRMTVGKNTLDIEETNEETGLKIHVTYFTLPGEEIGALVRKVEITNLSNEEKQLQVIDGMPNLIPYGVGQDSVKNMTQTAKAWMQVEDLKSNIPYFRVRASMGDTAVVKPIEGGNFGYGCLEDGSSLPVIVDPKLLFDYDSSLRSAVGFENKDLGEMLDADQTVCNELPCCFFATSPCLAPNRDFSMFELIGQVEKKDILKKFFEKTRDYSYFAEKAEEAEMLTEELCAGIRTKTANKDFDEYCNVSYLDNLLRGGYPMLLGNNKIFYAYSRKHGDLERDYNYFAMLPEFYSQGNGNFRDVNQNRRCDVFFAPFVGAENIKDFYSLIQLDGYNPLSIDKKTYTVSEDVCESLLEDLEKDAKKQIKEFVARPFTPGSLYRKLTEVLGESKPELFLSLMDFSEPQVNASFGEGYWSDHWDYNLDLIQDYLEVFPDKERELLYDENITTYVSQINVNRRGKRYEETENGLRQYHALDESTRRNTEDKLVREEYGSGNVLKMTLLEKLILLDTAKFANLDAYGMGIEMEGGKPGWYDALNGLPGIFGSSMAETYELARSLEYTIRVLGEYPGEVHLIEEFGNFFEELSLINRINEKAIKEDQKLIEFWNRVNDAKELYRDKTFHGISGKKISYRTAAVSEILSGFLKTVRKGIDKAVDFGNGICPTYFSFTVPKYEVKKEGIVPLDFEAKPLPDFLEGPVRYMKLKEGKLSKADLYQNIKASNLYDSGLKMYKVNASLSNSSYELGRCRCFTPGWLENESIWLHMEYKYLLELIRSGMYEEFFADFKNAAVPFLDPDVYGRSIYENSSFIASSANPNPEYRGKGFVARLSGSTIEFISMWKAMMFGDSIFKCGENGLTFAPAPAIPEYLIPEDRTIETTLFSKIKVTYIFGEKKDYIPGQYRIRNMVFTYVSKAKADIEGGAVSGAIAEDIRKNRITDIQIYL